MDPETSRQVIPALLALIGVLAGAVIAAVIQWRNTRATIEAAKNHEHAAWLRNHKAEVYAKFIDSTMELMAQCKWLERGPERQTKTAALVFEARPTLLRLVAPDEVRSLADTVYGHCLWMSLSLFPHEPGPHIDRRHGPHIDRKLEQIEADINRLTDLFRADLTV